MKLNQTRFDEAFFFLLNATAHFHSDTWKISWNNQPSRNGADKRMWRCKERKTERQQKEGESRSLRITLFMKAGIFFVCEYIRKHYSIISPVPHDWMSPNKRPASHISLTDKPLHSPPPIIAALQAGITRSLCDVKCLTHLHLVWLVKWGIHGPAATLLKLCNRATQQMQSWHVYVGPDKAVVINCACIWH